MINVANRVKKALFDKGWTQKKLSFELDVSENGLKNMLDKNSWKIETLQRIAEKLDLPLTYFVTEEEQNSSPFENVKQEVKGDKYLQDHLKTLELESRFLNLLEAKDRQIEGMQRTIDALLGKPEVVLAYAASCAFFFVNFGYNFEYNLLTNAVNWL